MAKIGYRGDLAERFEAKFIPEPNSGCWLWFGSIDRKGYGQIRMPGKVGEGRLRYATHVSLELAGRPLPDGLWALHHCDMPACVNPDHLFAGTQLDNQQDSLRKGRHYKPPTTGRFVVGDNWKEFCKRGHAMTADNLWCAPPPSRYRQCMECNRIRKAKRRARFVAQGLRCDGIQRQSS